MATGKGGAGGAPILAALAKRPEVMADPRPTSSAAWKMDAAQKVRARGRGWEPEGERGASLVPHPPHPHRCLTF